MWCGDWVKFSGNLIIIIISFLSPPPPPTLLLVYQSSEKRTLDDIFQGQPAEKKAAILRNMKEVLRPLMEKGRASHHIMHRLLLEYLSHAPSTESTEMVEAVREQAVEMWEMPAIEKNGFLDMVWTYCFAQTPVPQDFRRFLILSRTAILSGCIQRRARVLLSCVYGWVMPRVAKLSSRLSNHMLSRFVEAQLFSSLYTSKYLRFLIATFFFYFEYLFFFFFFLLIVYVLFMNLNPLYIYPHAFMQAHTHI